jgi:hypothetical protein
MRKNICYVALMLPLLLFGTLKTEGQSSFSLGITAGPTFSGERAVQTGGGSPGYNGVLLGHVGLAANIHLVGGFRLQPEILLDGNGISFTQQYGSKQSDITFYLKVPIYLQYDLPAGPGDFQIGVGPYFAKGIFGTTSGKITVFGNTSNDDIRGGDYGVTFMLQYVFHMGFFVNVNYEDGLENIQAAGDATNAFYNHAFGLSIGYFFGWRKGMAH